MADTKVSDLDEGTVAKNRILYMVDPDESAAADQSKNITIETLFASIVTHNGEVVVHNGDIVYT